MDRVKFSGFGLNRRDNIFGKLMSNDCFEKHNATTKIYIRFTQTNVEANAFLHLK